jgi:hypothetical protein
MSAFPGPQSNRGDRPIDTAPTAALPINVSTTRRERFMAAILLRDVSLGMSVSSLARREASDRRFLSRHRAGDQLPEKPTAWPNEPKPPRWTECEPESEVLEDEPEEDPLEEVLLRDDPPPEPPWLDEELREHSVLLPCRSDGEATSGGRWQLSRGISV